ncbi:MAG: phosphatase PAP2 family protein [Polyangiaceae bacterium]
MEASMGAERRPAPLGARIRARLRPAGWGAGWAKASLVVMPLIVLACGVFVGLRPEHVAFGVLFLVLAWAGPRARRFSAICAPFVGVGLAYDFLRLGISLRSTHIHVGDLSAAETALFGVRVADRVGADQVVSLSELVARHTHPILDAITGAGYICYLVEVVLVATYLYLRGDLERAQRLAIVFAATSALGWVIWLVWPAAPPWYVDAHGTGPVVLDAAPSAAGGLRFDALVHAPVFQNFYGRSWNIFGAMPSLHTSYAVLTAAVCWSSKRTGLRIFTVLFAADIAFGAVYLRHHYILDVLAGAALALVVTAAFAWRRSTHRTARDERAAGARSRPGPPAQLRDERTDRAPFGRGSSAHLQSALPPERAALPREEVRT